MSPIEIRAFMSLANSIKAREQLELQATLGALFDERRKEYQTRLAESAFSDDEAALAIAIEAITRK
jgi:hypothetical protein